MSSIKDPSTLGDIMNRTVAIYGKKFLSFALICAVIQVPLGLIEILAGSSIVGFAIFAVASLMAFPCLYAALSLAVVQLYGKGEVSVIPCYSGVGTRIKSLALVSPLLMATAMFDLGVLYLAFRFEAALMMIIPLVASVVVFVNMGLVVCSVTIEGTKSWHALRSGWSLLKGSLLRSLGLGVVVLISSMGFGLFLVLPFAAANLLFGMVIDGILTKAALFTVSILVTPLGGIALTLLYCDLRVRRGEHDMEKLANQMRLAVI